MKRHSASKSYYKVRKNRCMKRHVSNVDDLDDEVETQEMELSTKVPSELNHTVSSSSGDFIIDETSGTSVSNNSIRNACDRIDMNCLDEAHIPQNIFEQNMYTKIHNWAVNNIARIDLSILTDLLKILKSEGYENFPSTAHSFLGFKHSIKAIPMLSKRNSVGQYMYLGMKNGLEKRIDPLSFQGDSIEVLVFIDGMSVYKNSKNQLWPIASTVYNTKYKCEPFLVAIFNGDSKPYSLEHYLRDFVDEMKTLTSDGCIIHGHLFTFRIKAIIADCPARAYIKAVKSHTAFFGCERCIIKGETVNKKRVYNDIDCEKRTKESFISQSQKQHHQENITSPLIEIPNFDPVKDVTIDSMHLLYLGVMKNLQEKWLMPGSPYRIPLEKKQLLRSLMFEITSCIPCEFQRKVLDIDDYSHWKGTQFRFMLLYCGPIVLKFVLPTQQYRHFLLLHVACRFLCCSDLSDRNIGISRKLLRTFVLLQPSIYGIDSVSMNIHNLIHISDDVEYLRVPLSDISAFWGENFIGKLKTLVHSTAKPMAQIINRMAVKESLNDKILTRISKIGQYVVSNEGNMDDGEWIAVKSVEINEMVFKNVAPDNIALLVGNEAFIISKIYVKKNHSPVLGMNDFCIEGVRSLGESNVFSRPCSSKDIHVYKIQKFSESLEILSAKNIKCKCMLLKLSDDCNYITSLLH